MIKQKGMKVGAVSLWLLLLLAERPMYGYEIIKELEKKFSGYWKPKTGTIYPALEKLEKNKSVTSKVEFRDKTPDRKHYAITAKGQHELAESMVHWSKMAEIIENHWETHQAVFRHKAEITRRDLAKVFAQIAKSVEGSATFDTSRIIPSANKVLVKSPTGPIEFKFLYAKEKTLGGRDRFEVHIELGWDAKGKALK